MHKYNNSLQNITSNVYLLAPYCNNSMKSSVDGGKKDNSHFLEEVSIRDNLELLEDQVNAALDKERLMRVQTLVEPQQVTAAVTQHNN